jgi:DUF1009 family protein
MSDSGSQLSGSPLGIICGGGSLPFAVAEAAIRQGRPVVLFALRGHADTGRVAAYRHHWMAIGQYGRFRRIAREEGIRDIVAVGSVVRPALSQVRIDLATLRLLPKVYALYRGGDNFLLSGLAKIGEEDGFHILGAHEIAPDILVPEGPVGRYQPAERDRADIARGLALISAIGAFDIGQAAVVADNHVLAVEAIEGTDHMLSRVADLRRIGRIRAPHGTGVLVKAPKPGQERRVDLPSIGPKTVDGAKRAGLAGVAVVAGSAIIAEPQEVAAAADRAQIFVVGVASP